MTASTSHVLVPLTRSLHAVVATSDADLVLAHRWCAISRGNGSLFYAFNRSAGLMHRFLLGLAMGDRRMVDHIDGDGLNNRRENLRVCTASQNAGNSVLPCDNRSGFKGVLPRRQRWRAEIKIARRSIFLGSFDSPDEAAHAYDAAAREFYGDFACVNFPREGERGCRTLIDAVLAGERVAERPMEVVR